MVEFKVDNCNPNEIGEAVSALANTTALLRQKHGYVIWGIENAKHEVVGTSFDLEVRRGIARN